MENDSIKNSVLLWTGYALLFLATLSIYYQPLSFLGLVVLILGYLTRSHFRKKEQETGAAHASWQINTIWLSVLLGVLAIVALCVVAYWMGSDPSLEAKLDAISNGNLPIPEMLRQFWAIQGTKAMVAIIIVFMFLCLVWPLKRAIHGMLAMRAGLKPAELGSGRWLALALAIGIQAIVPMIFFCL